MAWAKRGWVCQKQERVRCCLCNKEILVRLNKKEVEGREEDVYVAQNIGEFLGGEDGWKGKCLLLEG